MRSHKWSLSSGLWEAEQSEAAAAPTEPPGHEDQHGEIEPLVQRSSRMQGQAYEVGDKMLCSVPVA